MPDLKHLLPAHSFLSSIDIWIVLFYAVAIFILAQVVSRRKAGEEKSSKGYFLANNQLPWWAIGASLIAANISAEQIVGMSGSGYKIGLAIASYEWMAAITLIIVGKYFLPVFLRNGVMTMPGFLEQRFGPSVKYLMAVFWLILYVFVNLTSILWLGATAVVTVTGLDPFWVLAGLGVFALLYQLTGGLKAVAMTDIVQVTLLVLGGLIITGLTLTKIGGTQDLAGFVAGFNRLHTEFPDHFKMILDEASPHYKELPGLAVILGGMWIMNISYWGFNQYIIQRALAAKDLPEAQKGIAFAAYLKLLMPLIVVVPGLAALVLAPDLARPDQAYPSMMTLLPSGLLGLVFVALTFAVIASTASKINSIATIFTLDIVAPLKRDIPDTQLVTIGQVAALVSVIIAIFTAEPLLGKWDQAFQYIQNFTGYFTPGIVVIFALGMFWKRCSTAGAFATIIGGVIMSAMWSYFDPEYPFMNRVGWVFVASTVLCVLVSLVLPNKREVSTLTLDGVNFKTSPTFNVLAVGVIAILVGLYAWFW
ncbi:MULTISPECIES: sodium:solute symporter family transporter [Asticcacaulis]|uniref:sodium:solute symporter family transporter n=1 Tax=Asticcacaulis TaxID=76890 RepID=UPI001AE24F07|nr:MULTISPECIES: sodium/solute symporter [Asticcacaulis]MBP2157749.1 SSS family solute:Na+ symporter [Asticcacaulis solisilvae]MDR6798794.1 SSS family solute:Na+ symporter [Asticcacaulis sp. BE141]